MALLRAPMSGFPAGGVSDVFTTPFPVKPGTKAEDMAGNIYVFCDFSGTGPFYYGVCVQISDDWTCAPLAGTANQAYPIGVVVASTATTDNGGWIQIYGLHTGVQTQAVSDTNTTGIPGCVGLTAPTSVCTPAGIMKFTTEVSESEGAHIYGMWVSDKTLPDRVTDSSGPCTNTSVGPNSAAQTSGTTWLFLNTISCFLNFPYVTGQAWELES